MNDFHARFEETNNNALTCVRNCSGGFSRMFTVVQKQLKNYPDSIVLNAGDNFQGTIWYSIYKWNVTQYFLNKLPIDAYTLGNHEFDDRIDGVIPFIKALKAPVLVSNIDDTDEPSFQGIYKKSTIIYRGSKKIGVIGVMPSNTNVLSSTGRLKFLDESNSVNKEAQTLVENENVDTIIVISHCGYNSEKNIAMKAGPKISIIVGAHSHTLLFNDRNTPNNMTASGPYPTVVNTKDGRKVLVVQAAAFTSYLGDITIDYNDNGDVVSWFGDPIYIDNNIPQDKTINKEISMWKDGVNEAANTIIGSTEVVLDKSHCWLQECNFGNFIADAMVAEYLQTPEEDAWAYATIALLNTGTIRTNIQRGNITLKNLLEAVPFENTVDVVEVKGEYIKEILERSVSPYQNQEMLLKFNLLSLSGIHIKVNGSQPVGYRIYSIEVLCRKCKMPKYEPLNVNKHYRIVLNSFLVHGGDNFQVISKNFVNRVIGDLYINVLKRYIAQQSPIVQSIEARIKIVY